MTTVDVTRAFPEVTVNGDSVVYFYFSKSSPNGVDGFDLATRRFTLHDEDVDFVNKFVVPGVWTHESSEEWTDATVAISDIREAAAEIFCLTGLQPNVLVLGERVALAIDANALKGCLEIDEVITLDRGGSALLLYRAPSPGMWHPSAGYTFVNDEGSRAVRIVSPDLGHLFLGAVA